MSEWDIIEICLKMFSTIGLHPQRPVKSVVVVFNLILYIAVTALVLENMVLDFHVEQMESLGYMYYCWIKLVGLLIVKRQPLIEMLEMIKSFKPTDFSLEENTTYRKYLGWLKFYIVYMGLCSCLLLLISFLTRTPSIFGTYQPEGVPRSVLYLAESYFLYIGYVSLSGNTALACTFVLMAAEQLGTLSKKIQSLELAQMQTEEGRQTSVKKLRECIIYHILLLRSVEQLNKIYSFHFLMQLGGDIFVVCLSMYGISTPGTPLMYLCRNMAASMATVGVFIVFYGYPAQLLMEMGEQVGNSIYCHCDWYIPETVSIRKHLQLILARSQKPLTITAGGLTEVNNTTLLLIMKTAYSFYTYLQTVS